MPSRQAHSTAVQTLDIRPLRKPDKHPEIFAGYAELPAGGSFVLINDHDPRHLREEFEADHAGSYGWDGSSPVATRPGVGTGRVQRPEVNELGARAADVERRRGRTGDDDKETALAEPLDERHGGSDLAHQNQLVEARSAG
jgi:uncharacterized protein (DUF2249 family)